MEIIEQVKKHPAIAVLGAVIVIWGVSRVLGGSGQSSNSTSSDPNVAAYYNAASAQAQAGDAVQIAQIQAQASTAQDLISTSGDVTNNTTWANTDLSETQSNNATSLVVAPIEAQATTQQSLISTLGSIASLPGTTTTSTTHGIFGGGGTYTTYTPNPSATTAAEELSSLESLIGGTGHVAGNG